MVAGLVEESGVIVLGVPVLTRYDLLKRLIESALSGSVVPDKIIVVDNGAKNFLIPECDRLEIISRGRNVGVSAAWNLIIDRAIELRADRCAISNDDIELYRSTFEEVLFNQDDLVLAPGFAFFIIKPELTKRLGWFDENLFPAYFEDQDFLRRLRLEGVPIAAPQGIKINHAVSATLRSWTHRQQRAFELRFHQLRSYYIAKWGGGPNRETFSRAFNGSPPVGWIERAVTVGGKLFPEPWRNAAFTELARPNAALSRPRTPRSRDPFARRIARQR